MVSKRVPLDGVEAIDAVTPERALMDAIIAAATRLGFMCYHTFDSRRSEPGFPDIFLIRPRDGRMLVIETKSQNGRLTDEQRHWLFAFQRAGVQTVVARPADLDYLLYEVLDP